MRLLILQFLLLLISFASSQVIDPTNVINSTHHQYIASSAINTSTYFANSRIECRADYCQVVCDTNNGCENTVIDALNASALSIECNNIASCSNLKVYGQDIISDLDINCNANSSCINADIHCPFSRNNECNIKCLNNDGCQSIDVFIADVFQHKLNITVRNDPDFAGILHCTMQNAQGTRWSINPSESTFSYNGATEQFECTATGNSKAIQNCCPFMNSQIVCDDGLDCQIDCTNGSCIDNHIDASTASSLSLTCGNNGCTRSRINCPIGNGAFCEIHCNESCTNTTIIARPVNDEYFLHEFNLTCSGNNACYSMMGYMGNTDTVNLKCLDQACFGARFEFTYGRINTLNTLCRGTTQTCSEMDMHLHADFIDSANLVYDAPSQTETDGTIIWNDITVNNLTIQYISQSSAPNWMEFNEVTINELNVLCQGDESCAGRFFIIFNSGNFTHFNLYCLGRDACDYYFEVDDVVFNDFNITCIGYQACSSTSSEYSYLHVYREPVFHNGINMICDGFQACLDFTSYGGPDRFVQVNIYCNGLQSCEGFVFEWGGSNLHHETNMYCNANYSCKDMEIWGATYNKQNIYCSDHDGSCQNAELIMSGFSTPFLYEMNILQVECPLEPSTVACANVQFKCYDSSYGMNAKKLPTTWIYDAAISEYTCSNTSEPYCCPLNGWTLNPTADPSHPTAYPTANPSQYPSASPTRQPSTSPSEYPSANPSKYPTLPPSNTPSAPPSFRLRTTDDDPFGEGEVSDKKDKDYTIFITVNDCSTESCVEWVKEDIMQRTHTTLNDELKQNVQIKTTEVTGNTIVSVVTISVLRYLGLETDPIAEGIETELNENGYDVDVEIKETDADSQDEEPSEASFFDQKWILPALVIGGAIGIACCCFVLVFCLCKRKHRRDVETDLEKHVQDTVAAEVVDGGEVGAVDKKKMVMELIQSQKMMTDRPAIVNAKRNDEGTDPESDDDDSDGLYNNDRIQTNDINETRTAGGADAYVLNTPVN
eukprot:958090_1